jgi:peptidoglycan/LPS O-acetylase OafA/YrhL
MPTFVLFVAAPLLLAIAATRRRSLKHASVATLIAMPSALVLTVVGQQTDTRWPLGSWIIALAAVALAIATVKLAARRPTDAERRSRTSGESDLQ